MFKYFMNIRKKNGGKYEQAIYLVSSDESFTDRLRFVVCTLFPAKSRGGTRLPSFLVGSNGKVLETINEKKQVNDAMNT